MIGRYIDGLSFSPNRENAIYPSFISNKDSPEQVIANERKKQSDAEAKIKTIQEQLSAIQ